MLDKFAVKYHGVDEEIKRLSGYAFDVTKTEYATKRNQLMRLTSGSKSVTSIELFEIDDVSKFDVTVNDASLRLVATIKPVSFDKLSGSWSVQFAEGYTPKREVDTARSQTFVKSDKLDANGKVVMTAKLDADGKTVKNDAGKVVMVAEQVNDAINTRVDAQEIIDETIRALRNETAVKLTTPRGETKAVLKTRLDETTKDLTASIKVVRGLLDAQKTAYNETDNLETLLGLLSVKK